MCQHRVLEFKIQSLRRVSRKLFLNSSTSWWRRATDIDMQTGTVLLLSSPPNLCQTLLAMFAFYIFIPFILVIQERYGLQSIILTSYFFKKYLLESDICVFL
jgi:hypothetical protein